MNAIIYTRVSTKEQADNNASLETQLKGCVEYAEKQGYNVVEKFGGTYESAQSDERVEFQKMISFAKSYKQNISFIIVYSLERFSRTGGNAIWLAKQLKDLGITILSVTQPIDTSNPSGIFQQNIMFLFGQLDNDLRREKSVTGMRGKLQKGYWIGKAPIGYDIVTKSKEQIATINETGKLLKKAFVWKSEGLTNTEILEKLNARGLKIYDQKLNWIMTNPFYCGIIVNKMLENPLEGKHPPLISKELFLEVNNIKAKYKHAKTKKEFGNTPLKHFLICGDCNTPFVGYEVKKKGLHYYKCAKNGCKCNRSAKDLHQKFISLLDKYKIPEILREPLKDELLYRFEEMNRTSREESLEIKKELERIEKKLEQMEERFALGDLPKDIFEKFAPKLKEEKAKIQQDLDKTGVELSNPEKYVDLSLDIASNLSKIWTSGNYATKEQLQYLVFPKGIAYDREKGDYRTIEENMVFSEIALLSRLWEGDIKQKTDKNVRFPSLVGATGFEPVTLCL